MTQKIKAVYGQEPMREGEEPHGFHVGFGKTTVYNIETVQDNFGTYGILWYVAYDKQGNIIGKLNALQTAAVLYYPKEVESASKTEQ